MQLRWVLRWGSHRKLRENLKRSQRNWGQTWLPVITHEALLPKNLPKKNYVKLVRIGYLWVFYTAYVHVSISLLKLKLLEEGIFLCFFYLSPSTYNSIWHITRPTVLLPEWVIFLRILIFYKFNLFLLVKPLFKASSCCCHFPLCRTPPSAPTPCACNATPWLPEGAVHSLLPCSEKRVFHAPLGSNPYLRK